MKRLVDRWRTRPLLRTTLVHGPNYFLPEGVEQGVITVHDLSVFRYPETHPVERIRDFERRFERSLRQAAHVITDTETVRGELIDTFGIAPESVTAVLLGVDAAFRPSAAAELEGPLRTWGLEPSRYALCVSTLEPRKKIGELLQAWRALPPSVRDGLPLVLAGGKGWRNDALRAEIDRAVAEGWLVQLGFVEEERLPALYAGARLFIYPSIYEGFGLPPLEAMASGVPVIVANRSCLPEVCGDAALYVDPDDVGPFAEAIERALLDETWRGAAVERGLARAAELSWTRCIEGTVGVYRKVRHAP
jgi:alpha-1,3-rhamnosyl/mannosyltransferase